MNTSAGPPFAPAPASSASSGSSSLPGAAVEVRQRGVHPEAAVLRHGLVEAGLMAGIDPRGPGHRAAPPVLGRAQAVEHAVLGQGQRAVFIAQQHHALPGRLQGRRVVGLEGGVRLPAGQDGHREGAGGKGQAAGGAKAPQRHAAALAVVRHDLRKGHEQQRDALQLHGLPAAQRHAVHRRLALPRRDPGQRRHGHEALQPGVDRKLPHIRVQVQIPLQGNHDGWHGIASSFPLDSSSPFYPILSRIRPHFYADFSKPRLDFHLIVC